VQVEAAGVGDRGICIVEETTWSDARFRAAAAAGAAAAASCQQQCDIESNPELQSAHYFPARQREDTAPANVQVCAGVAWPVKRSLTRGLRLCA
jgi:hypothetical protein